MRITLSGTGPRNGPGFFAIVSLRREPMQLLRLAACFTSIALLCLPLLRRFAALSATRSIHTVVGLPLAPQILQGFMPGTLAGVLILLVWVYKTWRGETGLANKYTLASALLIWDLVPVCAVFLFLLPLFGDFRLFVGPVLLVGPARASASFGWPDFLDEGVFARKRLLISLRRRDHRGAGQVSDAGHGNEDLAHRR